MAKSKNNYKNFYSIALQRGDCIRDYENYYIQAKYSRKELIEHFKKCVEENDDFSDKFKDFIKTSNNINYRMIYSSYYEVSCDIYYEDYESDGWESYYVGTRFYNTLKKSEYSPLLDIFRSKDGIIFERSEDGIDIVTNTNTLDRIYNNMIDAESSRWEEEGSQPLNDIRNVQKVTTHVPMLVVGYEFENEKFFSVIHAVTLQKYIAGPYSETYAFNELVQNAKAGDHNAQFELAYKYASEKNYKDAFYWYEKSSSFNIFSLNNLGNCYLNGNGCEKNYDKAFECFKKSSEKGNKVAFYNMGICYKNGYGCKKDLVKAVEYFENAKEKGYEKAGKEIENIYNNKEYGKDILYQTCINKLKDYCYRELIKLKRIDTKFVPPDLTYVYDLEDKKFNFEIQSLKNFSDEGDGKASYYLGLTGEKKYGQGCLTSFHYFEKSIEQGYLFGLIHLAKYKYPWHKKYYQEKLDLFSKFIALEDSYLEHEYKQYFSVAQYEMYLLMKKFKDKDSVRKFTCLYQAAKEKVNEAVKEISKVKDKVGLFYYAKYLEQDGYPMTAIKFYLKSVKKGFVDAQRKMAFYFKYSKPKKSIKMFKQILKNKEANEQIKLEAENSLKELIK